MYLWTNDATCRPETARLTSVPALWTLARNESRGIDPQASRQRERYFLLSATVSRPIGKRFDSLLERDRARAPEKCHSTGRQGRDSDSERVYALCAVATGSPLTLAVLEGYLRCKYLGALRLADEKG